MLCRNLLTSWKNISYTLMNEVMSKMVGNELCLGDPFLNKMVTTDGNKVKSNIHCIHCDKLKLELQKAKLEITSYKEILKTMQEEICSDPTTCKTTSTTWRKEVDNRHLYSDNTTTTSEWTKVSSKNHRKGIMKSDKGVTKINEHLNKTYNRFTPLTNLCDQQDGLSN